MTTVVLINPKYPHNVGGAVRAAAVFGADQVFWSGQRVRLSGRLPREERLRGYQNVNFEFRARPLDGLKATPIAVEIHSGSEPLTWFEHPEDATYVFGPEDGSIPRTIMKHCHRFLHIPAYHCLNLAAAVNVVLAHRLMWRQLQNLQPVLPIDQMLMQRPGRLSPELESIGWEGRL